MVKISQNILVIEIKITFFIIPTDKDEIVNIINNISMNKVIGPHSIPTQYPSPN